MSAAQPLLDTHREPLGGGARLLHWRASLREGPELAAHVHHVEHDPQPADGAIPVLVEVGGRAPHPAWPRAGRAPAPPPRPRRAGVAGTLAYGRPGVSVVTVAMSGSARRTGRGFPAIARVPGAGGAPVLPSTTKSSISKGTLADSESGRVWIPKCRCGPSVLPLLPSSPSSCPVRTRCPGRTRTEPVTMWSKTA